MRTKRYGVEFLAPHLPQLRWGPFPSRGAGEDEEAHPSPRTT